jgi:hypothetical protein
LSFNPCANPTVLSEFGKNLSRFLFRKKKGAARAAPERERTSRHIQKRASHAFCSRVAPACSVVGPNCTLAAVILEIVST